MIGLNRTGARALTMAYLTVQALAGGAIHGFTAEQAGDRPPAPCVQCPASAPDRDETMGRSAPALAPSAVKSWHYQLQNIDPGAIAASPADMAVIDYRGEERPFTKDEVDAMRHKPDGSRRIVLAYMSIGEAESYRWYWPLRSRAWLGREDPEWPGNYNVRFWHPDWQAIVFQYVDAIIAAGFDGVYLDRVDAFESMGHREDMVELVDRVSQRAKSTRADFLVVSQNGDALIPDPKFRRAIDAFAREDLFYGENTDGKRNPADDIRRNIGRLKMLADEGKPVFVVEYPRNDDQARTAWREINAESFIGLLANRALDGR
jgi:cysteinyl-tRNA synthetase, unknown class